MTAPPPGAFDADLLDGRFALPPDEGTSKVVGLAEAVRTHVRPGDTLHVGYSDARPNALLHQVVRTFAGTTPHFTLVTAGLVNSQHTLVEFGLVDTVVASFVGENYPVARPNPALRRAVRAGRVTIEHWSLWSLVARLVAGALGVDYFPVRSMRGSDMGREAAERGELIEVDWGGEPTCLVRALRPDVVLVHGAAADAHGNVVLAAPYGEGAWGALAARRGVVASVERIVSTEELRAMRSLVRIPAHTVLAVCEAPLGAHPYGFNDPGVPGVDSYVEDDEFMAGCLAASRESASFRTWAGHWILDVGSHDGYLERLGADRCARLRSDARPGSWREVLRATALFEGPAGPAEIQVLATAARLTRSVRERGHDVVLSGVGLANLAAWVGVDALHGLGVDVALMAEIGLFGYAPRPGRPFIFAGQNVPTNKLLTDVMGVLGTLVPGPGTRSVGVIGAGQIDTTGAINSTYGDDGSLLVGSGGANDVLSAADEVIITVSHQPDRLVERVAYTTCPGDRVTTIVTDLCVFERRSAGFVVTGLLPGAGSDLGAAVEAVKQRTGWAVEIADDVAFEPAPDPGRLDLLRSYDPGRLFLRDRRPAPG